MEPRVNIIGNVVLIMGKPIDVIDTILNDLKEFQLPNAPKENPEAIRPVDMTKDAIVEALEYPVNRQKIIDLRVGNSLEFSALTLQARISKLESDVVELQMYVTKNWWDAGVYWWGSFIEMLRMKYLQEE